MKYLKTVIESKIPQSFFQIFASIGFWNEEGKKVCEGNKSGTMGSQKTQEFARKETYEEFILNSLLCDITILLENTDFKFGKTGSHIYISDKENKRLLLIHF